MSHKLCLALSVIVTATMLLAACAPAAPVQPTTAPAATAAAPTTAAALPNGSSIKVGLVTDTGGVHDQSFNQLAWEGVQKAAKDMGFQATFIESKQPTDYEKNIDAFATEGYNVIITVGSLMGDVTALKAKQYPNITFAIIDNSYSDGGLANVTSLMFAEDQVGFLAGGMSKSGFVCSVSSMRTPQSDRYVISRLRRSRFRCRLRLRHESVVVSNWRTTGIRSGRGGRGLPRVTDTARDTPRARAGSPRSSDRGEEGSPRRNEDSHFRTGRRGLGRCVASFLHLRYICSMRWFPNGGCRTTLASARCLSR
jgi:hypothetical protein